MLQSFIQDGRVAQVIECLPSKCKALSSNPCTNKKRKKRKNFLSLTKSENKREEQVLPRSRVRVRWPKKYIHM
jgi:hypothetical protein